MKIIYIYDNIAQIGGVERIFVDKMNYLADKLHHEVYLITSSQGNHPISFPLSPHVRHIDLGIRYHMQYQYRLLKRLWLKFKLNRLCKRQLKKEIDKIDPDIIVCTTTDLSTEVCKLRCRAKKVFESHSAKDYTRLTQDFKKVKPGLLKDLRNKYNTHKRFRLIERCSDVVVTLTQEDAKSWKNASNVHVIPNMTQIIMPQSSTCEKPRVIAVGRLTYQKGFDRLINAWGIVYKQYPDWRLDIFGEGFYNDTLYRQIKEMSLEGIVTIHPFTSNILQEYSNSSIFALSSNYEGFGLVLIEAMGCGLPCVSFDCPNGPSEIIKHKEDGFLIKNGDIQGFAEALCHLIANEKKRKEFGKRARQNVMRYAPENVMPQWELLFNQLTQ